MSPNLSGGRIDLSQKKWPTVVALAALTLLAVSPFTRLVHIWSVPLFYIFRRPLLFRRQVVA